MSDSKYCIDKSPGGQKTGSATTKRAPGQKTGRATDKTPPKGK